MPIEIRSAESAFRSLTKMSRYPSPDRDPERYVPHPDVQHSPKFAIGASDKILTIGSCFARNIERALRQLDLNVLSSYVDGFIGNDNIANKYTSKSILNDLRLVLGDAELTDEALGRTIYVNDKGIARNLAFGGAGAAKGESYENVLNVSRKFYANLKKVTEADLVIITFGLIETWYDNVSGVYLNIPPSRGEIGKNPGRFALHVLSYGDVRDDMVAIFDLIMQKGKNNVQVLCTVSPVPLSSTFRDQDCLQANAYSKAVQRAALEEVLCGYDRVHYFPSYEMVTLASPSVAWVAEDYRHVQPATIDRIMRKVIAAYMPADLLPPQKSDLMEMFRQGCYRDILTVIDRYLVASGKAANECAIFIQYYYGASCLKVGRIVEGIPLLWNVVKAQPKHEKAAKLLADHA